MNIEQMAFSAAVGVGTATALGTAWYLAARVEAGIRSARNDLAAHLEFVLERVEQAVSKIAVSAPANAPGDGTLPGRHRSRGDPSWADIVEAVAPKRSPETHGPDSHRTDEMPDWAPTAERIKTYKARVDHGVKRPDLTTWVERAPVKLTGNAPTIAVRESEGSETQWAVEMAGGSYSPKLAEPPAPPVVTDGDDPWDGFVRW